MKMEIDLFGIFQNLASVQFFPGLVLGCCSHRKHGVEDELRVTIRLITLFALFFNCPFSFLFLSFFLFVNFLILQPRMVLPVGEEAVAEEEEERSSSFSSEEDGIDKIEEEENVPGPPNPGSAFYTSPEAVFPAPPEAVTYATCPPDADVYVPFTTYPGQVMPRRKLFAPSFSMSSSNKSPSYSSNTSPSSHSASNPECSSPVSSISFSISSPVTVCSTPPPSSRFSSPYCQTSPRFPSPLSSSSSPSPPPFPSQTTSTMTVASIHL